MDLPYDIIRHEIMPLLPASDLARSQLISPRWREAFLDGMRQPCPLKSLQSSLGGTVVTGFLLPTDKLQRTATRGRFLPAYPWVDKQLPAKTSVRVAASNGLFCLLTQPPLQLWVSNPVRKAYQLVTPPEDMGSVHDVGIAVFPCNDVNMPTYYLAIPIPHLEGEADPEEPLPVQFAYWNSSDLKWKRTTEGAAVSSWEPKNAVQIGYVIYFHASSRDIIRFDCRDETAGQFLLPDELHAVDSVVFDLSGKLAVANLEGNAIGIYCLDDESWIRSQTFPLLEYIGRNLSLWGGLTKALRSRGEDTAESVLNRIQPYVSLAGCAAGFALLKVGDKRWAFLDLQSKAYHSWTCTLNSPGIEGNRLLFACSSSLLGVSQ